MKALPCTLRHLSGSIDIYHQLYPLTFSVHESSPSLRESAIEGWILFHLLFGTIFPRDLRKLARVPERIAALRGLIERFDGGVGYLWSQCQEHLIQSVKAQRANAADLVAFDYAMASA